MLNAVKRSNLLSGEPEIEQWTEDNWDDLDIDESASSEEIFETINKRFEDDHRTDLSDILGDEKGKFLEFIEAKTKQSRADIEIRESEGLLESVSDFIRDGLFPIFR